VRAAQGESLWVFAGPGGPGQTVRGLTAQDITQGRGVVDEAGLGRQRHAIRFIVVVPDGVARVDVVLEQGPIRRSNAVKEKLLSDEQRPHGNVVAVPATGGQAGHAVAHDLVERRREGDQAHPVARRPRGALEVCFTLDSSCPR
jgi:hypothetical protein